MSLHSSYNPLKEAERYLDAFNFAYAPLFIVLTEPGESYLAHVIRTKFPDTVIIAIRYTSHLFCDSDALWDFVWRPDTGIDLEKFLFNVISDEELPLTVFLPWKPADNAWPVQAEFCWKSIASLIRLQQNVMYTRSHFGKQWLRNMVLNIIRLHNVIQPERIQKPIILGAAGPSLEKQFPLDHERFYICSVSSALASFQFHQCLPDLCIATDGGFWAGNLFRNIPEPIPVAFPLEACIPSFVLEKNPSVILDYGSSFEKRIFDIANIHGEHAQRNGTVTGTAAQYLLEHSDMNVYVAGLDLEASRSFSHARPHISDDEGINTSHRLQTLASSLFSANRNTASLEVYASWFASRDEKFTKRFIRLKPEGRYIQGITSVSLDSIQEKAALSKNIKVCNQNIRDRSAIKNEIVDYLKLFRSEIALCNRNAAKNSKLDHFTRTILQNGEYTELIQMICYTDFINMTRKIRLIADNGETESSIDIICKSVDAYLEKLITRVVNNE